MDKDLHSVLDLPVMSAANTSQANRNRYFGAPQQTKQRVHSKHLPVDRGPPTTSKFSYRHTPTTTLVPRTRSTICVSPVCGRPGTSHPLFSPAEKRRRSENAKKRKENVAERRRQQSAVVKAARRTPVPRPLWMPRRQPRSRRRGLWQPRLTRKVGGGVLGQGHSGCGRSADPAFVSGGQSRRPRLCQPIATFDRFYAVVARLCRKSTYGYFHPFLPVWSAALSTPNLHDSTAG